MYRPFCAALAAALLVGACNVAGAVPTVRVDDSFPAAVARPITPTPGVTPTGTTPSAGPVTTSPSTTAAPAGPRSLKRGSFLPGVHTTRGMATVYDTAEGLVLRLEGFQTDNGPDLYVYLIKNAEGNGRNEADVLNLGRLKSTNGNLNYPVPAGTNVTDYRSAGIWCKAFGVNFGYAPLN